MKAEPQPLVEEVSMNQEKNKVAYSRVEAIVDHMIELYEQADKSIRTGKNHEEVIQGLNQQLLGLRPLKTVREHFVHYYRKLSNLIRRLQNGSKTTNPALSRYSKRRESNGNGTESNNHSNNERFSKFFGQFITQENEKKALQRMIVEHFLREQKWECAKVWQQLAEEIDPDHLFNECSKLRDKIKKGQFDEAIAWCQSERLFESRSHLLEYELIKIQIISLVEKEEADLALSYFSKKLTKFHKICQQQIEKLMGFILFKEKTFWGEDIAKMTELHLFCSQRYAEFCFTPQKCQALANAFVKEYFKQNNISQFDVLKIVYECEKKISEQYQRLINLAWQSEGKEQKKYQEQLPFSIKLDKQYQYHSLFLCPVTKEVHSSGDTSVLLSCGHMISQAAQDRIILQTRNRRRVKCPICQKQIHPEDSISVQF